MSDKHNNLMAMRVNYWNDTDSSHVKSEKNFLQQMLNEHEVFQHATLDDAKYLFFSLPSIIIVKGYASGFSDDGVKVLIDQFIISNKGLLSSRAELKIAYKI